MRLSGAMFRFLSAMKCHDLRSIPAQSHLSISNGSLQSARKKKTWREARQAVTTPTRAYTASRARSLDTGTSIRCAFLEVQQQRLQSFVFRIIPALSASECPCGSVSDCKHAFHSHQGHCRRAGPVLRTTMSASGVIGRPALLCPMVPGSYGVSSNQFVWVYAHSYDQTWYALTTSD